MPVQMVTGHLDRRATGLVAADILASCDGSVRCDQRPCQCAHESNPHPIFFSHRLATPNRSQPQNTAVDPSAGAAW